MASTHRQQTYDHRLRDLVGETGDVGLVIDLGMPRSTASGWVRRDREPVVTLSAPSIALHDLEVEVHRLRARVHRLTVLLRVVVSAMRALQ